MKKCTLRGMFLVFLLIGSMAFGELPKFPISQQAPKSLQETITPAGSGTTVPAPNVAPSYYWDQPDDPAYSGGVSVLNTAVTSGGFSADDFYTTDFLHVTLIFVEGFSTGYPLANATSLNWYIYPDDGGKPAGYPGDGLGLEVWKHSCSPGASQVTMPPNSPSAWDNIYLDTTIAPVHPLNLEPGHYWLCFFPVYSDSTFWYWFRARTSNLDLAQIIDPGGFWGGGFTSWTPWPIVFDNPVFYYATFRIEGRVQFPTMTKWSQPPFELAPRTFLGWDEESTSGGIQLVADDWLCTTSQPVTGIHWWGSYYAWTAPEPPPMPFAPESFHIGIWTDVPANGTPFSHPGLMMWEYIVPRADLKETFVGMDVPPHPPHPPDSCFKYDLELPDNTWFYQNPGEHIYWLSITAIYPGGHVVPTGATRPTPPLTWGWKTRPYFANDEAVVINVPTVPGVGMPFIAGMPIRMKYDYPEPWDMAFELTTTFMCTPPEILNPDPEDDAVDVPIDTLLTWNNPPAAPAMEQTSPPYDTRILDPEKGGKTESNNGTPVINADINERCPGTMIDFDDITGSPWDGNRYAGKGVIFSTSPGSVLIAYNPPSTDTPPIRVAGSTDVFSADDKVIATLDNPAYCVSLYVGDSEGPGGSNWNISVYDINDVLLESLTSNQDNNTFRFFYPNIKKVVFTPSDDLEGVDTFIFTPQCPATYDVYFGTDNPPTSLLCEGITETLCDPGILDNGTEYFWYVVAKNETDFEDGPVWSFTTVFTPTPTPTPTCIPPGEPWNPDPPNEAVNVAWDAILSWQKGAFIKDLYAIDANLDQLFTLDRNNGASTLIGSTGTGPDTPAGLAFDGTNMYTIDLSDGELFTLDLSTGAPTYVGTTGINGFQGIASDPTDSGQLYGITQFGELYRIAAMAHPHLSPAVSQF